MLKKFQSDFQSYLLKNKSTITKNIITSKKLSAKKRLRIYQNGYYARMIQAMQQDFPKLYAALGESAFASLVRDYIDHYPSRHFNLRYAGKYLSEFILSRDSAFESYAALASLEWENLKLSDADIELRFLD